MYGYTLNTGNKTMLEWENLLLGDRRKKRAETDTVTGPQDKRTELERDFDRIVFSAPTRRLADKTQVFPLDTSDSIRTRLTHSYEVSNLARSIGIVLAFDHAEQVFGENHAKLNVQRNVPAILATIGLAHDLGNPPFGHQGEKAIRSWFERDKIEFIDNSIHKDFKQFDGNPHTFRLLTRLQILNDDYGLNMTYGTLSALIKYPKFSDPSNDSSTKKFGIFDSERNIIQDVWEKTGLKQGQRHPLVYIMEACDDIAYGVLDAEDTVKKGFASFYDLMDHLSTEDSDSVVQRVVTKSRLKNKQFRKERLSSYELNDLSMQMFRVNAIYELIRAATAAYVSNVGKMLESTIKPNFELVAESNGCKLSEMLKQFDHRHGFQNKNVLELEMRGHNLIISTMDMLWTAIRNPSSPFSKYARSLISENYIRVHSSSQLDKDYKDCQLLCDSIAGMTDSHLVRIHEKLSRYYYGKT